MKIYLSTPLKQRPKLRSFIKAVHDLKKDGHDVVDIYQKEKFPIQEDVNYFMELFKESEKAIRNADVVIIDVTFPSNRGGFEMARALDEKKYVIALSNEDIEVPKPATVTGNLSKYYKNVTYNNKNVTEKLTEMLDEAKTRLDTKFILIISPEIDRYLEWASDYKRMHKAQIVRNAVEKEIQNDKDYSQYREGAGNRRKADKGAK